MFRTAFSLKEFSLRFENWYSIPYRKLSLMVTLMVPNFSVNSLKLGVSFGGIGMESPVVLETYM